MTTGFRAEICSVDLNEIRHVFPGRTEEVRLTSYSIEVN